MTLLKLAIGWLVEVRKFSVARNSMFEFLRLLGRRLGLRRGRLGKQHAKDLVGHAEAMLKGGERGGIAFENHVHIKAGIELFVGHAGKIALIHFLDGLDFAAGRGDFGGNFVDGVLEAFLLAGRIEYEQTFVSFHFASSLLVFSGSSTTPLN